MKQILHIFRKDARHHWPEILISLVLLGLYTWHQPMLWSEHPSTIPILSRFFNLLPALMTLSWIFLIFRVIHSESLVGHRQFWTTRPYRWSFLLASKLLFVIVFFHLPLFFSHILLLHLAQYSILHSLPSLLLLQFLFFLVLVLPSTAIASVTNGLGQGVLALLILIVAITCVGLLGSFVMNLDYTSDGYDTAQAVLLIGSAIAVILFQFAFRSTSRSRLILIAVFLLIVTLLFVSSSNFAIRSDYPPPSPNRPLPAEFSLDHSLSFSHHSGTGLPAFGDTVDLKIPLRIDHVRPNTLINIRAMKMDLDLPAGSKWTSGWRSVYHRIAPDRTHDWPKLQLKRSMFAKYANTPVHAHATLLLDAFGLTPNATISVAGDFFRLPNDVRCMRAYSDAVFSCFGAMQGPGSIVVMANLPNASCPASPVSGLQSLSSSPASFEALGQDSAPPFEFTPVNRTFFSLARFSQNEESSSEVPICNGTSLFLANARPLYAVRVELDLGEIVLQDYLPGYPAKIVPTPARPLHHVPSDTLSQNNPLPFPAADDSAAN